TPAPPHPGRRRAGPACRRCSPAPPGDQSGGRGRPAAAFSDVRFRPVAPVDIQRRPVTGADPLPPRTDPPREISAPQQAPTADQDKGVFSALKRIPDLLRPDPPPAPTGETPRPPMPVGPASPEIK